MTTAIRTRSDIRQELADLRAEYVQIEEDSTAKKLQRNILRQRELGVEEGNAVRAESTCKSNSTATAQEKKLLDQQRVAFDRERALMSDLGGILPQRFVREDSVAFFEQDLARKRAEVAKMMKPFERSTTAKPGGWVRSMRDKLHAAESEWKNKTRKICVVGEQIFKLRQERRALQEQSDTLRQTRESKALATAGL